jgi:predicted permease
MAGLFGRQRRDRALDDEIQGHLDLLADDFVSRGMSRDDAIVAARRALGRLEPVKESYRDQRGLPIVDALRQDVRFAIRLLGRHRAFTVAAAGTLAVGIGVNTTFFTIVNAICIRGLPIDRPGEVLELTTLDPRGQRTGMSYLDFQEVRAGATRFSALAAYANTPMTIADDGRAADRITGTYISAGAFRLLGRPPVIGREFAPEDDRTGAPRVALLGHDVWASRYSADANIVGRRVNINGLATTVVGIVPAGFRFPINSNVWLPLASMPGVADQPRDARNLSAAGRLRVPGTLEDARVELEALGSHLARLYPGTNRDVRLTPFLINDVFNGRITDTVWLAFITAGVIVLLVSCANVANLFLMRSTGRSRELAIRASIGATRPRIVRQLLVECTLLSAIGGSLGLVPSILAARLLATSVPSGSPLPFWIDFSLDARVLTLVIATTVVAVFVCGLIPALQASDVKLPRALRMGSQLGTPTGRTRWLTSGFLAVELGLALVLVTNVAMAMQSEFDWQRRRVIDPAPLLTAAIAMSGPAYQKPSERSTFSARLVERLRAAPGVSSVTMASHLPLLGGARRQMVIEGRDASQGFAPAAIQTVVTTEHYFESLGLSVLNGRGFHERDGLPGQDNILVNQRFEDVHFPRTNAVGQRVQLSAERGGKPTPWLTIVGIVPTIRQWSSDDGEPVVYVPARADPPETAALIVRVTQGEPSSVAPAVRETVRQLDANLPLYRVMSLEQAIVESNWNGRVSSRIVITISTIALVLALIGQFVVTAQSVSQRTQEIGLRIAVGAGPIRIVRLVLRRALVQVSAGLAFGVLLIFALARLFPVPSSLEDVRLVATVLVLIVTVAMTACVVPALRAARVDPVKALRAE